MDPDTRLNLCNGLDGLAGSAESDSLIVLIVLGPGPFGFERPAVGLANILRDVATSAMPLARLLGLFSVCCQAVAFAIEIAPRLGELGLSGRYSTSITGGGAASTAGGGCGEVSIVVPGVDIYSICAGVDFGDKLSLSQTRILIIRAPCIAHAGPLMKYNL